MELLDTATAQEQILEQLQVSRTHSTRCCRLQLPCWQAGSPAEWQLQLQYPCTHAQQPHTDRPINSPVPNR